MKRTIIAAALAVCSFAGAHAADKVVVTPAEVDAVVEATFKSAPADWKSRVGQDETQKVCSLSRNQPSAVDFDAIKARELASIAYPADGNVMGDWKKGEKIAQTGTGGQFTDEPGTANGGNCYACHQLAPGEVSFGTLGPSLQGYGKAKGFAAAENKLAYAKIFNAQSVLPCSNMPRFGVHKFLTIEQIKDVTAYLMSPDSPVNK